MRSLLSIRARIWKGSLVFFSLMAVMLALWTMLHSPGVTNAEVLLFTLLVSSLLFPLFVMLHRGLRRRRTAPRIMVIGSMAWMVFSVLGAVANVYNGMGYDSMHAMLFVAMMLLFAGMFYASIEQLGTAVDILVRNSSRSFAQHRLHSHRA